MTRSTLPILLSALLSGCSEPQPQPYQDKDTIFTVFDELPEEYKQFAYAEGIALSPEELFQLKNLDCGRSYTYSLSQNGRNAVRMLFYQKSEGEERFLLTEREISPPDGKWSYIIDEDGFAEYSRGFLVGKSPILVNQTAAAFYLLGQPFGTNVETQRLEAKEDMKRQYEVKLGLEEFLREYPPCPAPPAIASQEL